MKKIVAIYLLIGFAFAALLLISNNLSITSSATEIPQYECGDNVCTVPLEDSITCPEDCKRETINPWPFFIISLIILFIGLFYFNFYKGKGDLRKVTKGKSPFKSHQDYKRVYNYIDSSMKINMEKKEIINNLYHKGWNKKQVIYAFEDFKWDRRKVLLVTAPKVTPNLGPVENYINQCRGVGIHDNLIEEKLIEKGWKKSHVKKAFRNLVHS